MILYPVLIFLCQDGVYCLLGNCNHSQSLLLVIHALGGAWQNNRDARTGHGIRVIPEF